MENPTQRFLVSPFFRTSSNRGFDADLFGGGIGYASVNNPRHPWSLSASYFNTDFDPGDFDFNTFDVVGKYVLWQPDNQKAPVVSLVGRYQAANHDIEDRFDVLLAADQRICPSLYLTANLGWADRFDSDFVAGFGATWRSSRLPKLSLSANYVVDNDVDGEDFWSLSAIWAFDKTSSIRVGGGKHDTWFVNYNAKWDWGGK
jgi:hypothetical protein